MISGVTKNDQAIFEVQDRVTDYICPKIVKVYNENDILASDISSIQFSEDVK